jgi:hypothetical protein
MVPIANLVPNYYYPNSKLFLIPKENLKTQFQTQFQKINLTLVQFLIIKTKPSNYMEDH